MLLADFFEETYRSRRLLGRSENTSRLYRLSITSFGRTLGKRPRLCDFTDTNLSRHIQRLLDEGRSVATANKDRAQLLALWRYAHKRGLVTNWPDVPVIPEPERTPAAWMPEDLAKLEEAVGRRKGSIAGVPERLWWRSLIYACLDTGERISAIRDATWDWVDGVWLRVPAEARKGKTRDRAYRLRPATVDDLEMIRRMGAGNFLWPWPLNRDYLWQKYGALLKEAGLPAGRRDKFHRLRRTTASISHAAGLDAQQVMDHEYRRTTRAYLDPRYMANTQPCDVLADFLGNPKKATRRPPDRSQSA